MTIAILSLVVLFQVGLFQFLAALANKSILKKEFQLLESQAPARLMIHTRRAPVRRIGLGFILAILTLMPITGLLASPVHIRVLLGSISLISGVAFLFENARDRVMMRLLAKHTRDGNVRRASLEPRSLRQWVHPVLEAVPLVLFVATLLFLTRVPEFLAADESVFPEGRTSLIILFGLQGLLVFGSHFYSMYKGVDVNSMATYIPSLRRRPEVAHRLGEEMAVTQVRFFMFLRIGIAALMGSNIVEKVFEAMGNPSAAQWGTGGWGLIGIMLIGFIVYLRKVGRISRRMQQESELTHQETAGAG